MCDFNKSMAAPPPLSDLTDFNVFASAMTTAPLDDLHKYFDSDDEQDLEDNYAGDDSDKENQTSGEDGRPDRSLKHKDYQPYVELDGGSDEDEYEDDGDDVDDRGQGQKYEYFDPRLDIDLSKLRLSHAASRHLNRRLQKTIDKTELILEQLSIQAQPILEEQPLSTRIILANQALDQVFKPYGMHGSQAQFSTSLLRFLEGGETVRRPGKEGMDKSKDGRLKFANDNPAVEAKEGGKERMEKLKRKGHDDDKLSTSLGEGREKIKKLKANSGDDIGVAVKKHTNKKVEKEPRAHDTNIFSERVGYGFQPASTIPLEGPRATVDSLSFRKTSGPLDLDEVEHANPFTPVSANINLYPDDFEAIRLRSRAQANLSLASQYHDASTTTISKTPFTPLATNFSQSLRFQSPITSGFSASQFHPLSHQFGTDPHAYSCTHDHAANATLAHEAYNPISLKFSWPATIRADGRPCMPTPGLLDALNNILHLVNAEARFMLSYYVRKYDNPAHLRGTGNRVEPPHALFRLGIAQYLMSRVGKMIDNKESDELGLNPEARRVLGEVWERHPSTQAWFDDGFLREDERGERDDRGRRHKFNEMPQDADLENDHLMSENEHSEVDVSPSSSEPDSTVNTFIGSRHPPVSSLNLRPKTVTGGLNPLEKALLARACNISVETVEAYWEDMRWRTRGWGAMKAWCLAADKMRMARVKAEGRW